MHPWFLDKPRLNTLSLLLADSLEWALDSLGVPMKRCGCTLVGPCHIHGGDGPNLKVELEGHTCPGFWKCYSRGCQETFGKGPLGLVRGTLSRLRGWPEKAPLPFGEAIGWTLNFLGKRPEDIQPDLHWEKRNFTRSVNRLTPVVTSGGITRDVVRSNIDVPSAYFLSRNFKESVLDKFDVGDYKYKGRELSDRAVAPVYSQGLAVGFAGRSILPECESCGLYHGSVCPQNDRDRAAAAKWRNHKLASSLYLYGFDMARQLIEETGKVILVEGPADVWRLCEAGIGNAVALFGTSLSDRQQILLEIAGALDVVVLLDGDEGGRKGSEGIRSKLGRLCRLHFPVLEGDPADNSPESLRAILREHLREP